MANLPNLRDASKFYWFTSGFRAGKTLPKMDISRLEYPLVYSHLEPREGQRILDIGAGYSIFPPYLASTRKYNVYITDSETNLPGVMAFHRAKLDKLGLSDDVLEGRVIVELQDVCELKYPTALFDRVSCISVIEHIEGDKDSVAIEEIGRVLQPGGLAVLTFPYARKYEERQTSKWVQYFERSYDEQAIKERLIQPSGLSEVSRCYFGEPSVHVSRMYHLDVPFLIRLAFEITSPVWALIFMRVWREPTDAAYGALLVLTKPRGSN